MTPEETQAFEDEIYGYVGRENGPPKEGNDVVNTAMIRQWAEIMQDESPVYTDAEAAARQLMSGEDPLANFAEVRRR